MICFAPTRFCHFQHLRAEVQTTGFRAAPGEGEGDVAGAAAQIESAGTGRRGSEGGDAAFPAAVQAEALEVVEQIVAPRDGSEEVVDLRGAGFAGRVKDVAHGVSLARGLPRIKAHKFGLRQRMFLLH